MAAPRTRNETIIIDRAKSLEQAVSEKTATLSGISRRIKQLNKDNSRKDEEITYLESTINDMIEKHTVSLDIVQIEHDGVSSDLRHELEVLETESAHLRRQVEHGEELAKENAKLQAEQYTLLNEIKHTADRHHQHVRDVKGEIIKQEEKLEKAFKKELVLMDAKYRQVAFDKLAEKKKKALLENAKLQEEIIMQKIGLVNLKERMFSEDQTLKDTGEHQKLLSEKEKDCSSRIAKLRRSAYAYEARMADMDVTVLRLAEEEEKWRRKVELYPMGLGDTNREVTRLRGQEEMYRSYAMKWKSRFLQIHQMIAEEKKRKMAAIETSTVVTRELPEGPEDGIYGEASWTSELANELRAKGKIESSEFHEAWNRVIDAWGKQDGDDAVYFPGDSRPNTVGSRAGSSRASVRLGGGPSISASSLGNSTIKTASFAPVLTTSESTPLLRSKGDVVKMAPNVNTKSAPDLEQVQERDGNKSMPASGPKKVTTWRKKIVQSGRSSPGIPETTAGGEGFAEEEETETLPMLTRKSNRSILDEDAELMELLAKDRRREEEIRLKQAAIADGDVSVEDIEGMMKELERMEKGEDLDSGHDDDALGDDVSPLTKEKKAQGDETERSHDTILSWIENFKSSKRLDIASTGMVAPRLGNIGMANLLKGNERIDWAGMIKVTGEAPRKRLVGSLEGYKSPEKSMTFRKRMLHDLKQKKFREQEEVRQELAALESNDPFEREMLMKKKKDKAEAAKKMGALSREELMALWAPENKKSASTAGGGSLW